MSILSPPPADPAARLLFTTREAAGMLSLSERTVWALCRRGELRSVRVGRALRISADELRAWIARQSGGVAR